MKLFKNIERHEHDKFDKSAFIVFGKCLRYTNIIQRLPDGTALDNDNVFDGWYIRFSLPISLNKKYVCHATFESKIGKCKPAIVFRIRKEAKNKYFSISKYFAWIPIEETADIKYNDPYLAALNIKDKI